MLGLKGINIKFESLSLYDLCYKVAEVKREYLYKKKLKQIEKSEEKKEGAENTDLWFIHSDELKDYLRMIKKEFTDFERASLIYNSLNSFERIMRALRNIMENTTDLLLVKQLEKRIAYEEAMYKAFSTVNNQVIYSLETYEEKGYEANGFFSTLRAATDFANILKKKYIVTKKRLFIEDCLIEDEYVQDYLGSATYNAEGELLHCSSNEVEEEQYFDETDDMRFEYAYVFVPHPFRTGDIVRIIGTNGIGIVTSPKNDDEMYKNEEVRKAKNYSDYTDMNVGVDFLCEDGDFVFDYTPIMNLEYAKLKQGDIEKELMEEASELIRGHGSIPCFLRAQKKYCSIKKRRADDEEQSGISLSYDYE